ncbi:hypothetical protein BH11MYX4_BH11MYX4_51580 [soil metagenome]
MVSSVIQRVSLFVILAAGIGCKAAPVVEAPAQLSFRPTRGGAKLWLATPFAVELVTEHDARAIEALDAVYVGEIGVSGGRVKRSKVAAVAAEWGATHFRIISAGDELRVDVVLYRVDPERWARLPATLQPAAPATSSL